MDRIELIRKIKTLEGLTNEEKSELLGLLQTRKKYGLVWEDKVEDVEERLRDELPILREVKDKYIPSDAKDAPNHILIEGDNLEALTALSYTHEGKIDVIYIDPPYNRGEEDFKYNDNYIDKDNPFKHSMWLSFMKKRLKIAKSLLSPRGVIITHIDEHEFDALHMLYETEIFNESSNLGVIIWNKMNPKGDAHSVAIMHEYILIFCKNKDFFMENEYGLMREKPNANKILDKANQLFQKIGKRSIPEEIKAMLKSYGFSMSLVNQFSIDYDFKTVLNEFQNWLRKSDFSKGEKAYKYINKQGEVFRTVSMAWPNKEKAPEDYWIPLYHPITGEQCPLPSKGWRNPSKTMAQLLGDKPPVIYDNMVVKGEIAFTRKKNGTCNIPERVYYLKDNMLENVSSIYNDGSSNEQLFIDLGIKFPYPKCLNVAKYLLSNVIRDKNITILDFFAGSGTTLHATMLLNEEDNGNRKCILITNNESNICEEVTYVRGNKVINGYTTPKGLEVEGLHNNRLRYYQTDFISRDRTQRNMRQLVNAVTDMLCIKEDLYTEQQKFGRWKMIPQIARYFSDGKKHMLVVYNEQAASKLSEMIAQIDLEGEKIKIYIFSPERYAFDDEFYEVQDKVQLVALPAAIYDAYQKVLPKRRPQMLEITEEKKAITHDLFEEEKGGEA